MQGTQGAWEPVLEPLCLMQSFLMLLPSACPGDLTDSTLLQISRNSTVPVSYICKPEKRHPVYTYFGRETAYQL